MDIRERLTKIAEDGFVEGSCMVCAEAAAEITRLREALEWYASPEIYKPHPHGLAFDQRDLSYRARAALGEDKP